MWTVLTLAVYFAFFAKTNEAKLPQFVEFNIDGVHCSALTNNASGPDNYRMILTQQSACSERAIIVHLFDEKMTVYRDISRQKCYIQRPVDPEIVSKEIVLLNPRMGVFLKNRVITLHTGGPLSVSSLPENAKTLCGRVPTFEVQRTYTLRLQSQEDAAAIVRIMN